MSRAILRLAANEYIEWSTVVDAPATYIATCEQAVTTWGAERTERADTHAHSWMDAEPMTPEEAIRGNRSGPGELTLTLDGLRRRYRSPETERTPIHPQDLAPCPEGCGQTHHPWTPCGETP